MTELLPDTSFSSWHTAHSVSLKLLVPTFKSNAENWMKFSLLCIIRCQEKQMDVPSLITNKFYNEHVFPLCASGTSALMD